MSYDRDRSYGRRDSGRSDGSPRQRHSNSGNNSGGRNSDFAPFDPDAREVGTVERILQSFGFISCAYSNNLFFHFNGFRGDARKLNPGDLVEFNIANDASSNRPYAVNITLAPPGAAEPRRSSSSSIAQRQDEQGATLRGVVDREPKRSDETFGSASGRIEFTEGDARAYASFGSRDVEGDTLPRRGDTVEFALDRRGGGQGGRRVLWVRFAERAREERFVAVVSSVKDSYGFVERCDGSGEIFFHFSECLDVSQSDGMPLVRTGDEVEHTLIRRSGRLMAGAVRILPPGTVSVELSKEAADAPPRTGVVQQTPRAPRDDWAAVGLVYSQDEKGPVTLPFVVGATADEGLPPHGEDVATLKPGDHVEYRIATCPTCPHIRRAVGVKRASREAAEASALALGRETGVVATVREGFGFIKCCDRDARVFFHFSELLDAAHEPRPGDEFEFSLITDKSERLNAVRIAVLPRNSVSFFNVCNDTVTGKIERAFESTRGRRSSKGGPQADRGDPQPGLIRYTLPDGTETTVELHERDAEVLRVDVGDEVEFNVAEDKRTRTKRAVNVVVTKRLAEQTEQGFVTSLKDHFGFIETADRDREVFFHYSEYDGSPNDLRVGDEVEFGSSMRQGKPSAVNVKRLPAGTIRPEEIEETERTGTVVVALPSRPSESTGSSSGKIQYSLGTAPSAAATTPEASESKESKDGAEEKAEGAEGANMAEISFAASGVRDKRGMKVGDKVTFRIATQPQSGRRRAVDVRRVKPVHRALVERTKGQFGFIGFKADDDAEGSLYYHQNDVDDGVELHSGDEVEFSVQQNPRTGKPCAVKVRRIKEAQKEAPATRPSLLLRRQGGEEEAQGPRFGVSRQPKGPDGTRGFDAAVRPSFAPAAGDAVAKADSAQRSGDGSAKQAPSDSAANSPAPARSASSGPMAGARASPAPGGKAPQETAPAAAAPFPATAHAQGGDAAGSVGGPNGAGDEGDDYAEHYAQPYHPAMVGYPGAPYFVYGGAPPQFAAAAAAAAAQGYYPAYHPQYVYGPTGPYSPHGQAPYSPFAQQPQQAPFQ